MVTAIKLDELYRNDRLFAYLSLCYTWPPVCQISFDALHIRAHAKRRTRKGIW